MNECIGEWLMKVSIYQLELNNDFMKDVKYTKEAKTFALKASDALQMERTIQMSEWMNEWIYSSVNWLINSWYHSWHILERCRTCPCHSLPSQWWPVLGKENTSQWTNEWLNEWNQSIIRSSSQFVSWEPEGHYQYSTMFHWEPEGCYCCTKSTGIGFSTEHSWTAFTPFWFSVKEFLKSSNTLQQNIVEQHLHPSGSQSRNSWNHQMSEWMQSLYIDWFMTSWKDKNNTLQSFFQTNLDVLDGEKKRNKQKN